MIIRSTRKTRFTVIPNELLEDSSLDWKDLGMLVYLLSKPDNWEISVEHLKKQRSMGRDAIYKCLDAIILAGYAKREKKRDGTVDWMIFDEKVKTENLEIPEEKPNPEKPEKASECQILKSRITEIPYYGNTDTNKDLNNKQVLTNKTKTKSISIGEPEKTDFVLEIFTHWKTVMDHPRTQLDSVRKKVIKTALDTGYSVDDLKDAITGCSLTPWNIGDNDKGQRYDGIDLIFRNADQIDRFINNSINPPINEKKKTPQAGQTSTGFSVNNSTKRSIANESFSDKQYGESTINLPWLTNA